jgi:hypothetical protein
MGKVYLGGAKPVCGKGQTDAQVAKMVFEVLMLSIQNLTEVIEFIGGNAHLNAGIKGCS